MDKEILLELIEVYKKERPHEAYTYYADGEISGYTIEFVEWLVKRVNI